MIFPFQLGNFYRGHVHFPGAYPQNLNQVCKSCGEDGVDRPFLWGEVEDRQLMDKIRISS